MNNTVQFVEQTCQKYENSQESLIMILQDIQGEYKYLPEPALREVSTRLNVPLSQVYGVATFYKAFSLQPRGKHLIQVCCGTACHVKGAPLVVDRLERALGIKCGNTTKDKKFTLETVRCVGACALAPVVMIGEDTYGRLTQDAVDKVLKKY
jgi:NADH-quinone oxidoreductase E subunit